MADAGSSAVKWASIESLQAIACPQLRARALQALLIELGFRWIEIVHVDPGGCAQIVPVHELLAPPEPAPAVVDPQDPRLLQALRTTLPWAWDIVSLVAAAAAPVGAGWLRRLVAGGASSGLSHALRHEGGACVVSLLSRRGGRRWMSEDIIGRALLLECYLVHSATAARDAAASTARAADQLSDTQREILNCLSQGMGDKVIADRLGLSTHNVDYHMRRLRQRFGVRNRVQLARATQQARGDD